MLKRPDIMQGLSREEYERKKDEVADALVKRLEAYLPGLQEGTVYREVRRFPFLSALPGSDTFGWEQC